LPLITGLIAPSFVLIEVETIIGRVPLRAAVLGVISQEFAEGENVFLLTVIGLIPFVLLAMFSFVVSRRVSQRRLACVSLGGLLGILAYMIPAHVSIWRPLFAGEQVASTAAIGFLFIPFYCVPALAVGLFVGWLISLIPSIRAR